MKENRHTQIIPSTVLTQAQTKIDEAKVLLAPYLLALTPAERRELPKMGETTISFVEKAFDFARQNPKLVPPYLDVDAFGVDFSDVHGLWTLLNTVQQIEEGLSDTEMIAGSEAYQAALVFYKSVKMAAASNRGLWASPAQRPTKRNSRRGFPGARLAVPAKPNSSCRTERGTAGIQSPDRSMRNRTGSTKSPGGSIRNGTRSPKRQTGSI